MLPSHFRFIILSIFHLLSLSVLGQGLVLNECMSSNESTIADKDGEFSDWIELYNSSSTSINLKNYSLSDKQSNLTKWSFPETSLAPNEYLVVFASNKDINNPDELHTNFKISQEGETIYLTNPSGQVISEYSARYIPTDNTIGRMQDGTERIASYYKPSPGQNNQTGRGIFYSHASGFYEENIALLLAPLKIDQSIHYTLNGDTPSNESPLYNSPISFNDQYDESIGISLIPTTPLSGDNHLEVYKWKEPDYINKSHVIRFGVFEDDSLISHIYTHDYFVGSNYSHSFPILSLVTDSQTLFNYDTGIYVPGYRFDEEGFNWIAIGNYHNRGVDWERKVHVSYYDNEQSKFSTDAGMRMRGYGSTAFPQKSFGIYFRKEYGSNKVDLPIFEQSDNTEYKRLIFRNSGQDFLFTHFQDALLQSLLEPFNLDIQRNQPSIVYFNGEYWGIHNIREKYDKFYFKYNNGIAEEDINILGFCGQIEEGNNDDYIDLLHFVESNDLSTDSNYYHVAGKIDIENHIDFQIAEIFYANYDWPCNNYKVWKSNQPESKWRFLIYDLDLSFGYQDYAAYDVLSIDHATSESNEWPHCGCSNTLFRNLLKNETYKQQFIDRFTFHLNNNFHSENVIEKIGSFQDLYAPEMENQIKRWHYPSSLSFWQNRIGVLKEFALKRPCNIKGQIMNYFQLNTLDFDCSDTPQDGVNKQLTVAPNPTDGHFYLANNTTETIKGRYQIITPFGQLIYSSEKIEIIGLQRTYLDLSNLQTNSGTYFLRFENDKFTEITKLVFTN